MTPMYPFPCSAGTPMRSMRERGEGDRAVDGPSSWSVTNLIRSYERECLEGVLGRRTADGAREREKWVSVRRRLR